MRILHDFFDEGGNLRARVVDIEGTNYLMYDNCDEMLEVEYSNDELRFPGIDMFVNVEYSSEKKDTVVLTKDVKRELMDVSREYDVPFDLLKYLYSLEWVGR